MKIGVLDHGYVSYVEHWGSDERIIESARMSTGKGFLGWDKDTKLLKYLWNHKHLTPFEMCGLTVEVQAPIFVFREWHRHRTQCLAGDTKITCITPNGTPFKRTIKQIFELKHGGVSDSAPKRHKNGTSKIGTPVTRQARRKDPWRVRILPNCQNRMLRVLNESNLQFETAAMDSVWESGVKDIYKLTIGSRSIKASSEHPFFTKRGWVKLKDIVVGDEIARQGVVASTDRVIPNALRSGIGVWTTMMRSRLIGNIENCYICGNKFNNKDLELDHVIPVSEDIKLALDVNNLKPACVKCHRRKSDKEQPSRVGQTRVGVRWEVVDSIPVYVGKEMTYDMEVSGEHHNYVANDFVVHNSYNEMSARYIPIPDLDYVPSLDRLMMVNNGKNKQAGTADGAKELTQQSAMYFQIRLSDLLRDAQNLYTEALDSGVPKELARGCLTVSRYSKMRASANLRNWLGFLSLRDADDVQWETREYAKALKLVLEDKFPRTLELFNEGRV